jgi:hypothetical protein
VLLTNAEWDRIEACAAANWSAIRKAREEEDVLKEKEKKKQKQRNLDWKGRNHWVQEESPPQLLHWVGCAGL